MPTYILRPIGGTLILNTTPPPASTVPTAVALVTFRSGTSVATFRDGKSSVTFRDGVVKAGGR